MFNKTTIYKKGIVYILPLILLLLLPACGATATTGADEEGEQAPAAVLAAQSWLAEQLSVAVEEVNLLSTEQMEWTDSCLGLGGAAESCAAVMTPGWQANFEVEGQEFEVRLDESGTNVRSPQIALTPPILEEN